MSGIIIAAIVVGATGIGLGFFLTFMGKKFAVEVDEKEEKIRELLPGNNCGACGFPGCDGAATAIAKGDAAPNICPVGGPTVADQISEIVGSSAGAAEVKTAFVMCAGTCDKAKDIYDYDGVKSCLAASSAPGGGGKGCSFGCKGFGDCVAVCDFDAICEKECPIPDGAIHVDKNIAKVDYGKCVGCGKCAAKCPKKVIKMFTVKK